MMMKLFGAALIVSGGYLLGKFKTSQWNKRLKLLREVQDLFTSFDRSMREYRQSINEFLKDRGLLANDILNDQPIKGLLQEDQQKLTAAVCCYRTGSYRESIEVGSEFLAYLNHAIVKTQEDITTSGKAIPLVTGAIGLLVSVLLF
jgi:hypothetical protein